jgi:hypothetical protein
MIIYGSNWDFRDYKYLKTNCRCRGFRVQWVVRGEAISTKVFGLGIEGDCFTPLKRRSQRHIYIV